LKATRGKTSLFLKPFEDQGTEITAEENGPLSIQLKSAATDKVKQTQ
jgi:hypothetical protein